MICVPIICSSKILKFIGTYTIFLGSIFILLGAYNTNAVFGSFKDFGIFVFVSTKNFFLLFPSLSSVNWTSSLDYDTMKYFQCSLAQIASTATNEEKTEIKNIFLQFLVQHNYFGVVWRTLTEE